MKKYSIVIPCYNEEKNLPTLLNRFKRVIKTDDIEVILVNNGSIDNSSNVLKQLLPSHSFAKTVTVRKNKGYGHGILAGLKKATGDYIGWTHADLQTDPNDVIKAFEYARENHNKGYFFIKGIRKKRPITDKLFSAGMTFYDFLCLKKLLVDINAQPTIFPCSFFKQWKNPPKDFSLDLYAFYLAKKHKLDIVRIPVHFAERIHGASSWNTSFGAKMKFVKENFEYGRNLRKKIKQKEL